jgi:hypothetical protein
MICDRVGSAETLENKEIEARTISEAIIHVTRPVR